jgi:hypothetical protein
MPDGVLRREEAAECGVIFQDSMYHGIWPLQVQQCNQAGLTLAAVAKQVQ